MHYGLDVLWAVLIVLSSPDGLTTALGCQLDTKPERVPGFQLLGFFGGEMIATPHGASILNKTTYSQVKMTGVSAWPRTSVSTKKVLPSISLAASRPSVADVT
jgi:hypothetical protein